MSIKISLKKGLDLNIAGKAPQSGAVAVAAAKVAVTPDDFPGFTTRLEVAQGDTVTAGQPLMHDKTAEAVKIVSPVSGTVKEVVRGQRRKIERVVIEVNPDAAAPAKAAVGINSKEAAREFLMNSGLWVMMRQRPYDIVPSVEATPRDIFVSGFDSAPLAPVSWPYLDGKADALATGVKLLKLLTTGNVYVSRRDSAAMPDIAGAEMVDVSGPHPAGNAGVLAANVAPVDKGETIWCLDAITLARIGQAVLTGHVPFDTMVAVTGPEVTTPKLVSTVIGASIAPMLADDIADDNRHHRIISGNVLTGRRVEADGYLRYPYTQLTVIAEGDDVAEFLGWATLSPSKTSVSRSFPGHFFKRLLRPDARIMGGRRAMIMSGEYDKVIPMDIMAEYLIKAILSRDIDRMEALGIYEVAPEDFAVAEYVDTSKLPLQQIVREGLDYLRKELS